MFRYFFFLAGFTRTKSLTPALYLTLTDVFIDETKNLDSCKGMKFDPPSKYDILESNGRTINTTVAIACTGWLGQNSTTFEYEQ